jgi:hypothetical protein
MSVIKEVISPIAVIVVGMVFGGLTTTYITVQLQEEKFIGISNNQRTQAEINVKLLETIRQLEISDVRAHERSKTVDVEIERLRIKTENRFTSTQAAAVIAPLQYRLDDLTKMVEQLREDIVRLEGG